MAKQDIYLGVEGNDGTGDSIPEAFPKQTKTLQNYMLYLDKAVQLVLLH